MWFVCCRAKAVKCQVKRHNTTPAALLTWCAHEAVQRGRLGQVALVALGAEIGGLHSRAWHGVAQDKVDVSSLRHCVALLCDRRYTMYTVHKPVQ
jgi:hypothetical protein